MNLQLSEKDINELKYQCRAGIVIPAFLFLIVVIFQMYLYIDNSFQVNDTILISLASAFAGAIILSFIINRKYYADLRIGDKETTSATIQHKMQKKDFEAGSGIVSKYYSRPMNEFIRYDIMVNNIVYRVDKEFYDKCSEGDEIVMYYARKSRYLLGFELKKQ